MDLSLGPLPRKGLAYRIVVDVEGQQEITPASGRGAPREQEDRRLLELFLEQSPTRAPAPDEVASLISVQGLRARLRRSPPPSEREIELADDRLRVRDDGKVSVDLRGAQPRENLTPRMMLGHPLAVLRQDLRGEPLDVVIRGSPAVRKFLRPLSPREALAWTRVARPEGPVAPGARWRARRVPPNPIGALGLSVELEYQLAGFETLEGAPCAWILVHGAMDTETARSLKGFPFDRAFAEVNGEAWIEVGSGRLRRLVLEDEFRVAYRRGKAPVEMRFRFRYKGRTTVDRAALPGKPRNWADGTTRFSDR